MKRTLLVAVGLLTSISQVNAKESYRLIPELKPTSSLIYAIENPIDPPTFSIESGFFTENFDLVLSHLDPEVEIYYTLDGSTPSELNTSGTTYYYKNQYKQHPSDQDGELLPETYTSHLYSAPIAIYDRSSEPNKLASKSSTFHQNPDYIPTQAVGKAIVVRAIAVKGEERSVVLTHTYFVSEAGANRYSLPVIALNLNEDLLFDYEIGTNNAGEWFDEWRAENPEAVADFWSTANYWKSGSSSEHALNFTYFENGQAIINHGAGMRNHGNSTRSFPNKSWRLYAKSEYGSSNFNHAFYENDSHNAFKRIILRNSGNDSYQTMFRDAVVQKMMQHLQFETQGYQPAIVYLNGEYWGIFNMRERFDEKYFKRKYNIPEDKFDFLEYNGTISEGQNTHYLNFISTLNEMDTETPEAYTYLTTNIDPDNYTDYLISYLFAANFDWPNNNIEYWRKRTTEYVPDAPYGHDGRWRWVMKDMDVAFNGSPTWINHSYTLNMLNYATQSTTLIENNIDWPGFLIRKSFNNPQFRSQFITRFADLLNTTFLPQRLVGIIDETQANLAPEMQEHIERWSMIENLETWESNVEVMREFANLRPTYQRLHLQNYFNLTTQFELTVDVNEQAAGNVQVNTILIDPSTPGVQEMPYPWNGIYFSGVDVKLVANPMEGYQFSHWSGDYFSTNPELIIQSTENVEVKAHFIKTVITNQSADLLHYWVFDQNMDVENLQSTYSLLTDHTNRIEPVTVNSDTALSAAESTTDLNYLSSANQELPYTSSNLTGLQITSITAESPKGIDLRFSKSGFEITALKFAHYALNMQGLVTLSYWNSTLEEWTELTQFDVNNQSIEMVELTDSSLFESLTQEEQVTLRLLVSHDELTEVAASYVLHNLSVHGQLVLSNPDVSFEKFVLYPNPTSTQFTVQANTAIEKVQLYSIDGKKVREVTGNEMNVANLPAGLYIVKIYTLNEIQTEKIVIN